ncbi:hypothetical protein [Leuconostoc pseudomesenteroides]|uniref:hypothetical protein n=1 Tax=Leuconostoc pseudomesenteroides TaxID=33968 RepID=UPI00301DAB6E
MKIVSLQSVDNRTWFEVGKPILNLMRDDEISVTEIKYNALANKSNPVLIAHTYQVKTSDGHIRVLPADKYIAEWSDGTDRISPDEIGNDIHEFLHGGDK